MAQLMPGGWRSRGPLWTYRAGGLLIGQLFGVRVTSSRCSLSLTWRHDEPAGRRRG